MIRFVGLFYLVESLLSFTGVNAMHGRESSGHEAVKGIMILGKSHIGRIDDDFVCATLDWWRPQKCDYGTCRWGHASLLNLVFFLSFFVLCYLNLSNYYSFFRLNFSLLQIIPT
ncbi:hypothetical protein S83_060021 [Arachis hypogaea]